MRKINGNETMIATAEMKRRPIEIPDIFMS